MQQFVKAAQKGDPTAWNILFRQHYPWLYAIALRICGNSAAAKDAVQDTFIQAFLKLQQLKDPVAISGWLKTILTRCCYRYTQRQLSIEDDDVITLVQESCWEDEINNRHSMSTQQTRLYHTLESLSEPLRSVLLLRYFSNWQTYEQIARILCVPVGTIRSRLNQAKQKMIEHWTEDNSDTEKPFQEAKAWDHFYQNYFGSMHFSLDNREKFLQHLEKNLQLIFTSGKTVYGREMIEKEIEEDLLHGSGFGNIEVMSSGAISIVEVCNINSREYPNRCPDTGIFVLYRSKNKVSRLNFHNSQ